MWGTPVGPTTTSSSPSSNVPPAARMETFVSDDSNEFNGQRRCHVNRVERTKEFSSDEEEEADDKTGRFLYPVLDLHKGGLHGQQNDSPKLWPSPPQAHSRSNPFAGLPFHGFGGFSDRGLLHHHHHHHHHQRHHQHHHLEQQQQQQQQHDRMGAGGRTAGGIGGAYNMRRIDPCVVGRPDALSIVKGPGALSSVSAAGTSMLHGQSAVKLARGTVKSYHCRMCEQEFENKSDMQRHAKDAHRMDEKGHKCSKCCKSFPSTQQLVQHSLVHTNVRKYPCRFCEKAFKQLSHVQQHQRIHTGERPYQCTVEGCPKAFRQLSSLQQHIKGHNIPLPKSYPIAHTLPTTIPDVGGVRGGGGGGGGGLGHNDKINSSLARPHDLTCQVCEKQCVDEVRFFRHIHKYHPDYWRVFSGGRPLNDFIEVQEAKLQRGNEKEEAEEEDEEEGRAYSCGVCHKTCSSENGYWKHITTQHPGMEPAAAAAADQQQQQQVQLYRCLVCKKLFTKKGYLLRHMEMKVDAQHCRALVELRKNSALFLVSQADTYLGRSPPPPPPQPPSVGQQVDDAESRDDDSKPHLADVDSGIQVSGAGGSRGAVKSQDRVSAQPRQAHSRSSSSSAYQPPVPPPPPPLNRSLSLDHHQAGPYGARVHGSPQESFRERSVVVDRCSDSSAIGIRSDDVTSQPGMTRLVGCDPPPPQSTDGATVSPNASSLSGASSPCSPISVQSFSCHGGGSGGGEQHSGRAVASDGRPSSHQLSLLPLYSSGVHVGQPYYSKSAGQETLLQGRGGGGGGYHGDDDDDGGGGRRQRSSSSVDDDDHKPFAGAARGGDYLDDHPGSSFVHPSYGGGGSIRAPQDSLVMRRGEATDVCDVGMDLLQRHQGAAAAADDDVYLRRGEAGEQGVDAYLQQQQQGRETGDGYLLHRSSDALERDLSAYLRRCGGGGELGGGSEVDSFLRRNSDVSECYIASALSQLARSMPGFR